MPESIDFFRPQYWLILGAGLLLLVPLKGPGPRKLAWAGINAAFLVFFTGAAALAVVAAALAVCWGLKAMEAGRAGLRLSRAAAALLLGLFAAHKLPGHAASLGAGGLLPVLSILGFSYVTLRLIDVWRDVRTGRHAAPDGLSTINYLLPFHMLAAGPIQSYDDFLKQSDLPPSLNASQALVGIERIAAGLFKKYVLAFGIESVFLTDFRAGPAYTVIEAQLYYLWMFLDFSAYTDIAVGSGILLGVATPENFNRPYLARNMVDFWERWHISLSQFIRRHLYTPLQLSIMRKTKGKAVLQSAVVGFVVSFVLCGLWHQLNLRWLLWGAFHAAGLVGYTLYKQYGLRRMQKNPRLKPVLAGAWVRCVSIFITFEFVAVSQMIVGYHLR